MSTNQLSLFDAEPTPAYTPPAPLVHVAASPSAATFDDGHLERVVDALAAGQTPDMNPADFYATPPELAALMTLAAGIADLPAGAQVLEPSAGTGALADAILQANPQVRMTCYEIQRIQQQVLQRKGYTLCAGDFLSSPPQPIYQAIVMNPPFKDAIAHVFHAWHYLAEGGVLVCLGPTNWHFGSKKEQKKVRALFEGHGVLIKMPRHVFAALGKETEVPTVLGVAVKNGALPPGAVCVAAQRAAEEHAAEDEIEAKATAGIRPLPELMDELRILNEDALRAFHSLDDMMFDLYFHNTPWDVRWDVGL